MSEVRTRFAPSPTGFLHVGSARTAFWAWLLAKHNRGKFILRIEDTDQERLVPGAVKSLFEEFAWFGIQIDEGPSRQELLRMGEQWEDMPDIGGPYGPYVQSQRLERYREVAEELIRKGAAYRCDCTPEMLEEVRREQMVRRELPGYNGHCRERNVPAGAKHVVRFKMPAQSSLILMDAIKGKVAWDNASLRDTVILKSGGFPTYHLAAMVDDHDMKVSHILRGDEWLSTAPLHILIFEAMGWSAPVFAHLPVIMGPHGKKLSKRDGAVFTSLFREQGYLPEALLNFLVLIGWSAGEGNEQEVFSRPELIESFSLEHVNNASGRLDYEKLAWMNGVYLRKLPLDEFVRLSLPFIDKAGLKIDLKRYRMIAPHVQERAKTLQEAPAMVDFLCAAQIQRDMQAMYGKGVDALKAKEVLSASYTLLEGQNEFNTASLEAALRALAEQLGLKAGALFGVLRIAVTGKKVSLPLCESMAVLGKELVLTRIQDTAAQIA